MSSDVLSVAALLPSASRCAGFDPELLSGADCAALSDELAAAVKAGEAALSARLSSCCRLRCSQRAGLQRRCCMDGPPGGRHHRPGPPSLGDRGWLGRLPRYPLSAAGRRTVPEPSRRDRLGPSPRRQVLKPSCSKWHGTRDLAQLRDKAREHRQANTDVNELHRQQLRARHFRHWRDRLGMVCFTGALPPETGVPFINRLELAAQRARTSRPASRRRARTLRGLRRRCARGDGDGEGPARSARADLVIVCDLFAWRRGHTHPGEVCQVIGGGPVPVELAHELGKDAFLKAVLHDGVALHTIKHFGRHFPAELRTALDLGPVPAFTGARCGDCGSRFGLEYDHVNPVANKGETSLSNVQALCWDDHQAKTERDRQAGLLGPDPPYPP